MIKFCVALVGALTLASCCFKSSHHYSEFKAPSRNMNVCGHLKDSVVLYCIFVDVNSYHPFSQFDVNSTMDSVRKATEWLECQAEYMHIPLSIQPVLHKTHNKVTLQEWKTPAALHGFKRPFTKRKYASYTNKWTDFIAKYAGRSVKQKNTGRIKTRVKAYNLESLIHILRNNYQTDGMAVMFFVNGYYEREACMSFNIYNNGPHPEYAVITHKNTSAIAHEFLHLFGGIDLYPHRHHPGFNYADLEEIYPNEIMRIAHKDINKLMLSPITKYYIGWQDDIPKSDLRMLYHYGDVLEY